MAADAYAALRQHVPELPALPDRETLRGALEIGEMYMPRPLWTDEDGFSEHWQAVRCELANQRFELKLARKPLTHAVELDEPAAAAVDALLGRAPAAFRVRLRRLSEMRMPIDRWIELARVGEDLLAELLLEPIETAAAGPAAPEAAQSPPGSTRTAAAEARPAAPAEPRQ